MKSEKQKIAVFDTTLRDGEQSPGASMTPEEKLLIARQLEKLGVDVIEAGFPVSSEGDFKAVRLIAEEIRGVEIAAIARAVAPDIDRAWNALKKAFRPRIHVFISSSDIHLKHQLMKSRAEVLGQAYASVVRARTYTDNVEFSAMDATRTDREYLRDILTAALAAGATTVNVADTVGYAVPDEFGALIAYLMKNVSGIDQAVLSVHCHDDLGLATANSLAAVRNGARQVKCTINGIGERAGNAALEEVVMALRTREDFFGLRTGIRAERIYETSCLVSRIVRIPVQPNKAVVGANAFAHESGIHQDGIIKERSTYEIMTPQSVGIPASHLTLGKHSGRHAIKERLKILGYAPTAQELDRIIPLFKALADRKKCVSEDDLMAILREEALRVKDIRHLDIDKRAETAT
ncbi:MAG TPA: 2-isopropylmalate synthase [Syntrophorhabdales bacterium]|nr:2-isopropylmalate synthase [Syntrophorhabdales bacterium]